MTYVKQAASYSAQIRQLYQDSSANYGANSNQVEGSFNPHIYKR